MAMRPEAAERLAALWMVRRRFLPVPGTGTSGACFVNRRVRDRSSPVRPTTADVARVTYAAVLRRTT
jgi:hypothetical protein